MRNPNLALVLLHEMDELLLRLLLLLLLLLLS